MNTFPEKLERAVADLAAGKPGALDALLFIYHKRIGDPHHQWTDWANSSKPVGPCRRCQLPTSDHNGEHWRQPCPASLMEFHPVPCVHKWIPVKGDAKCVRCGQYALEEFHLG